MSKLRARASLAFQIANVSPQKFNDAVADNFYVGAPPTVRGAARIFDVDDIVGVFVFARLLDEGLPPRHAGDIASNLRMTLLRHDRKREATSVFFVTNLAGKWVWLVGEDFDPKATESGGAPIVAVREWRLKTIREHVSNRLDDEGSIVG